MTSDENLPQGTGVSPGPPPPALPAEATGQMYEVESAFVTAPADTALEEQRERLRAVMDRGSLVLLIVGGITFLAAVLNTIRGNFSLIYWFIPLIILGLAGALYWGVEHFSTRPQDAIEVPAELVPLLNDITVARAEVLESGERVLDPEERIQVVKEVDSHQQMAYTAAQLALKLTRSGDLDAAALQTDSVYQHVAQVEYLRNQTFQEWEGWQDETGFQAEPVASPYSYESGPHVSRVAGTQSSVYGEQQWQAPQPVADEAANWSTSAVADGMSVSNTLRADPAVEQFGATNEESVEAVEPVAETTRHFWSARKRPNNG